IRIIGTPAVVKKSDKKKAAINFTLAWDNSWKSSKPANWDAAWIYVKCWDGNQWNHVYLDTTGHTPGNPDLGDYRVFNRDKTGKKMKMAIECGKSKVYKKWGIDPDEKPSTGVVGVFLYRKDSLGSGNVVVPGISLLWTYTDQNFTYDDDLVVKVFAVEMVYVPEGPFYIGGKGTAGSQPHSFTSNAAVFGYPYYVKSEKPIVLANSAADTTLWTSSNNLFAGTLPAAFPKGYRAFYIMKYELTQEAYADFLNTLNQGQQDGRTNVVLANVGVTGNIWDGSAVKHWNGLTVYRQYIMVTQRAPSITFGVDANQNGKANETMMVKRTIDGFTDSCAIGIDGQDIPVTYVSMYDLLAYADFAGLRPMTELEYEKACRGNQPVVNDEYAWGSVTRTEFSTNVVNNRNRGDEYVGDAYNTLNRGVVHHWWYSAPLRVGIFADSTSTRPAAGASYWGVMNMSDNVFEMCIGLGYNSAACTIGRKFQGVHGDGQLEANGQANVAKWAMPANASQYYWLPRGIVTQVNWSPYIVGGMVSNRNWCGGIAAMNDRGQGGYLGGIRCVRTAGATE
ncbi:MAG: SUMF1/EgtB/PvdO family nonheme iron enzyme, partial [Bacteroidales bacterium]|nr:SUMF1/EgtB/PvdO family nonheme iron enzyme [Bacteroidales bacterium]